MKPLTSNARIGAAPAEHAGTDPGLATLHALGFRPAYYDCATCTMHPSLHADGSPAEDHVLDGLPDAVVVIRCCDRVIAAKASLMAGFERNGYFYTRASARRAAADWGCLS
jgi:hypothetical protein